MTAPSKINFKIYQGSTFTEVLRWESSTKVYKDITSISKTAPMVVTAASHGLLAGWRAKITNVTGMTDVNSLGYLIATAVDANTITFNSVNAAGFRDYVSGGVLEYNEPKDLSGLTARMQIRAKLTDTTALDELTTENGGIDINNSTKTITLNISAADTAAYTFSSAVYSIELVSGSTVTPFAQGTLTLAKEVTR